MLSFDFEGEIEKLTAELLELRGREEAVQCEIDALVQTGVGLPKRMYPSLNRLVKDVALVNSDASELTSSITVSCDLADSICSKVRELDVSKSRVVDCLQLVEDVLDLRACTEGVRMAMANEDYEQAAAHVSRFLTLDSSVLEVSRCVKSSDDVQETHAEAMEKASLQLKNIVEQRFADAVQADDMASAQRFFKLFPLLKEHEQGVAKYGEYLKQFIASFSEGNYQMTIAADTDPSRANVLYADSLTILLEGVARVLGVQQPMIDTYYGSERLLALWTIIQDQCDFEAGRLFDSFIHKRQLNNVTRLAEGQSCKSVGQVEKIDPLELDILLTEMTLIHTRVEMYYRFLRRRIGGNISSMPEDTDAQKEKKRDMENAFSSHLHNSALSRRVQELLGCYILLEEYYMRESMQKAVKLEYRDDGALCSSIADDVFFIVRKSIRRALSSSNVDCVCAMLNHACSLLESTYLSELKSRLKPSNLIYSGFVDAYSTAAAAYASVVQQGRITGVGVDPAEKQWDEFLVALNNCSASVDCMERLSAGLRTDFKDTLGKLLEKDRQKLDSCLAQFEDVQKRCNGIAEDGIGHLMRICIKSKLKLAVEAFFSDTHSPSEFEFGQVEARNLFVESLVSALTTLSNNYKAKLVDCVYSTLLNRLCSETASQVEKVIMKGTYNRLGGLLLDKQIRELANFWTTLAGWSARENFARLNQISCLLNVDSVHEAKDFCQSDTVIWLLTPSEVRQVLALRIDLPGNDIRTIRT